MKETRTLKQLRNKKVSNTKSDVFSCLTRTPDEVPVFKDKVKTIKRKHKKKKDKVPKWVKKELVQSARLYVREIIADEGIPSKKRCNELALGTIERREINLLRKRLRNTKKTQRKSQRVSKRKRIPKKYSAYINSSWWVKRRNRFWRERGRACQRCSSHSFLQVHHAYYDNSTFGDEPDEYLFGLCQPCHQKFHEKYGVKKNMIRDTKEFISNCG